MLVDFVPMSPGDCFVQNGANSAVGQAAIQIGKEMGVKSINVVRKRDKGMEELKDFLEGLGADRVITGTTHSLFVGSVSLVVCGSVGVESPLHKDPIECV